MAPLQGGGRWAQLSGAVACALLACSGAHASDPLCALFEDKANGDYMFLETAATLQAASRRSLDEPTKVGFSAVKGALARRLSADLNGQVVRWSGAVQKGPYACAGYKVVAVAVDPLNVHLVPEGAPPANAD